MKAYICFVFGSDGMYRIIVEDFLTLYLTKTHAVLTRQLMGAPTNNVSAKPEEMLPNVSCLMFHVMRQRIAATVQEFLYDDLLFTRYLQKITYWIQEDQQSNRWNHVVSLLDSRLVFLLAKAPEAR